VLKKRIETIQAQEAIKIYNQPTLGKMKAILVLLCVTRHGASKHLQCGSVTGKETP